MTNGLQLFGILQRVHTQTHPLPVANPTPLRHMSGPQHLYNETKSLEMKSRKHQRSVNGFGQRRYNALRKRQIKIDTKALENAAKEYRQLLGGMCQQKLATNFPYVK